MSSFVWCDIVVDIVLIAIICFGFIYGAKCGVVKVIEKPFKLLSSFVFAAIASVSLSSTIVFPAIKEPLLNKCSESIMKMCADKEEIPLFFKMIGVTKETLAENSVEVIANILEPVFLILAVIITFFVAYLLGKLLLSIAFGILNLILNIGFLKYISRLLGAVIGLAVFFVIASIAANAFGLFASLDLLKNVEFFSEFTGGVVYDAIKNVWTLFFGF